MAIESPHYKVEKELDGCEIRVYSAYVLAHVDVESDFDGALRNGFEILAHYIFGGNRTRKSIPMTAPSPRNRYHHLRKFPCWRR